MNNVNNILGETEIRELVSQRKWAELKEAYEKNPIHKNLDIIEDVIVACFHEEHRKAQEEKKQIPGYGNCLELMMLTDDNDWSPLHEVIRYGYWDAITQGFYALDVEGEQKENVINKIVNAIKDIYETDNDLEYGAGDVLKIANNKGWTVAHELAQNTSLPEKYWQTEEIMEIKTTDGVSVGDVLKLSPDDLIALMKYGDSKMVLKYFAPHNKETVSDIADVLEEIVENGGDGFEGLLDIETQYSKGWTVAHELASRGRLYESDLDDYIAQLTDDRGVNVEDTYIDGLGCQDNGYETRRKFLEEGIAWHPDRKERIYDSEMTLDFKKEVVYISRAQWLCMIGKMDEDCYSPDDYGDWIDLGEEEEEDVEEEVYQEKKKKPLDIDR